MDAREFGGEDRTVLTDRLLLLPITDAHAGDIWRIHQDPWIAHWADEFSHDRADEFAAASAEAWRRDGIHKWIAYERNTGSLVGRGGLSRLRTNASPGLEIAVLLEGSNWPNEGYEVGWSVMGQHRGKGLAVEIGAAAITVALNDLGATQVVAFTEQHNRASRRVMEKLGMTNRGEIRWRGLVEDEEYQAADAPFAVYATPDDNLAPFEASDDPR